jgi:hypothetical protein
MRFKLKKGMRNMRSTSFENSSFILFRANRRRIAFLLLLLPSWCAYAATNAQTFTYQGRFFDTTGTNPLADTVDITFSIYNPTESCLLYEETDTSIDLASTNGLFSVQVGSSLTGTNRTTNDPGLSMAEVFANQGTLTGHAKPGRISPFLVPGHSMRCGKRTTWRWMLAFS